MIRSAFVTAIGVAVLVFLALRLAPGDPIDLMLGESAAPASRETLRAQLGLDQPLPKQFLNYATSLLKGDLGTSITRQRPVRKLIAEALPFSLLLAIAATLFANALGVPAGVLGAYRPRSLFSRTLFGLSVVLAALPSFWIGPLLVIAFSLRWPWLPVSGFQHWSGLILPTLAIGIGLSAWVAQTTRAAVSEVLASDFIRTARAKGASEAQVLFKHALGAAFRPIVTVSTLQLGHLLAGAVIIETIFDWPGIGKLAYDALLQRDYPTVQGTVLVVTLIYVGLNTLTDLWLERGQ